MRKASVVAMVIAVFLLGTALPAAGVPGTGELNKAFHAGLSNDQINPSPAGRIKPFLGQYGITQEVCTQQLVGIWIFWISESKDYLAATSNDFTLDGQPLEVSRTGIKRAAGSAKGFWFAEGVPVLGVLEPGYHTVEWTSVEPGSDPVTVVTNVHVADDYC